MHPMHACAMQPTSTHPAAPPAAVLACILELNAEGVALVRDVGHAVVEGRPDPSGRFERLGRNYGSGGAPNGALCQDLTGCLHLIAVPIIFSWVLRVMRPFRWRFWPYSPRVKSVAQCGSYR